MKIIKRLIDTPFGYKVFREPPNQNELNSFYAKNYYQNPVKDSTYQIEYSIEENLERSLRIKCFKEVGSTPPLSPPPV